MSKIGALFPIVVSGSNKNNTVVEVFSEQKINQIDDTEAINKGLSPIVSQMMPAGIYRQSYHALQLVRAFIVYRKSNQIEAWITQPIFKMTKIPQWVLYEFFNLYFNLFTYTHTDLLKKTRTDVNGVKANVAGDSCELSVALSLLLPSNSNALPVNTCVIATGALGGLSGQINIIEVGRIAEKLQLILTLKKENKLTSDHYIFYTPIYMDATQTEKVINRPEIELLKQLSIEVRPRGELKEIVEELKLLPMRLAYKRLWLSGLILSLATVSWNYQDLPIKIDFQAIKEGFKKEPFLICNKYGGESIHYYPFEKDGSYHIVYMPAKSIDNWYVDLGWSIKMPEETGLNAYYPKSWQGYYVTYINVAEKTGTTVYPDGNKKLYENEVVKRRWQLKEPAQEEGSLFAILINHHPVDLIKLESDLSKIPAKNHSKLSNYLTKQADGVTFFHYLVKLRPSPCTFD